MGNSLMGRGIRGLMVGLLLLAAAMELRAAERPNILFILTDDQAPWALGLAGHPHASTPHLDALFRSGAYLVNSFTVTPVCSPSRASLICSRYGSEVGITDWIKPGEESALGLNPKLSTWPRLLQQSGYRTALIGKWHLGTEDRFHPTLLGYTNFMGLRGGGTSPANPKLEVDGVERPVRGLTTDILTDEAIRWLRLHQANDGPFALSLHYRAPHSAWLPVRESDWEPFDTLDPQIPKPDYPNLDTQRVKKMTREYLASVKGVDRNVGRLLEELKLQGYEKDTIVIFSSDHGYNMGHNGIWHKGNGHWVLTEPPAATSNIPRGQRPNMYDNSLRVPTCVRWPGVIPAGTVIHETISNLDWFPTIVELAGSRIPKGTIVRGHSLVPVLRGEAKSWDNDFYAEYSTKHQSHTHMRMYRTAEWKLIRDFLNSGRDELYDLRHDPAEQHNLIDSTDPEVPKVIANLHARILEQMRAINDPVLPLAEQR